MTTVTAKPANVAALELTSWRRHVGELYAAVRALDEPERAHALWRSGRDAEDATLSTPPRALTSAAQRAR